MFRQSSFGASFQLHNHPDLEAKFESNSGFTRIKRDLKIYLKNQKISLAAESKSNFGLAKLNRNPNSTLPVLHGFGEVESYSFIVTSHLGVSLAQMFSGCAPNMFTICRIGIDLIEALEELHNLGYCHLNINPHNVFVPKKSKATIANFELSERFQYKEHISLSTGHNPLGTAGFMSLNAHSGLALSRRDDIISLSYLLMFLVKMDLPWQLNGSLEQIRNIKQKISLGQLKTDLPAEIISIYQEASLLPFETKPDYALYTNKLKGLIADQTSAVDPFLSYCRDEVSWSSSSEKVFLRVPATRKKSSNAQQTVVCSPRMLINTNEIEVEEEEIDAKIQKRYDKSPPKVSKDLTSNN